MVSPLTQALAFQNSVSPAQSGIAPTDVVGAYHLASDAAEKNYQAKLAQNNAMWGGLAGLGGAGIVGLGPSLLKKYMGAGANTAAGASPVASAAAAADPAALPATAAPATGSLDLGLGGGLGGDAAAAGLPTFGVDALGAGAGAGTVAGDLGFGAAAAPTIAGDIGAAGLADAGATAAASAVPDWLASLLPFLAFA